MMKRDHSTINGMAERSRGQGSAALGGLTFADILSVLWRRKIYLIGGALLGVLLAILFTVTLAPKFVSKSVVLVDLRRLEVAKNGLIPNVPPSVLETLVNSERSLLTSNRVLKQVVEQHDLQLDPEFGGSSGAGLFLNSFKSALGLGGAAQSDRKLAAAAKLRKALTVIRKKDTVVLTVALSSNDPAKSQKLNQAILSVYLKERDENARASVNRVVGTLEAQLNGQAQAVARAEEAVEAYKVRNNIVDSNGQLNKDQQISTVTDQLNAAQLETTRVRSRYEQMRDLVRLGKVEAAGSTLFQSQLISDLRSRLLAAKDQKSTLQARLQPAHPSMVEVNTRIASLKNALQLEARDALKVMEQDLKRAGKVEAGLKNELAQLQQQTGLLKKSLVPLRELERKAEAARSVYVSTLTRIREIRAQQGVDDSNVRVISDASLPLQNERISRKLLVLLGAALGGSIGAFVGFFTAFSAGGRVRKAEQLQQMTGLPVLARLPVLDEHVSKRAGLFGRGGEGAVADLISSDGKGGGFGNDMLGLYSALRSPVDVMDKGVLDPDVLLLVGVGLDRPLHAYGANLAALAHGDGDHVLYLAANAVSDEKLAGYITPASIASVSDAVDCFSLSSLSSGRRSELQKFALMLDGHIDDYDFALLDGGDMFAQPALNVLSYFASHILLVVEEKVTDFDALDRAYQTLGEAREKVAGCLYLSTDSKRAGKLAALPAQALPLSMVEWPSEAQDDGMAMPEKIARPHFHG